jgi:hypothetical protein
VIDENWNCFGRPDRASLVDHSAHTGLDISLDLVEIRHPRVGVEHSRPAIWAAP